MGNCLKKNQEIRYKQDQKFDLKTEEMNANRNEFSNFKHNYEKNHIPKLEIDNCIIRNRIVYKNIYICMNCKEICVGFEAYRVHFFDKHVCKIRKIVR